MLSPDDRLWLEVGSYEPFDFPHGGAVAVQLALDLQLEAEGYALPDFLYEDGVAVQLALAPDSSEGAT